LTRESESLTIGPKRVVPNTLVFPTPAKVVRRPDDSTAATTQFHSLDYKPKLLFRQFLPTTIQSPPFGNEVLVGLDEGSREF